MNPCTSWKKVNNRLVDHYLQYQLIELLDYNKEFVLQFSDITDEELILPIVLLFDFQARYSQHTLALGKTRQNFHVPLKPKAVLKSRQANKVPLELKERPE